MLNQNKYLMIRVVFFKRIIYESDEINFVIKGCFSDEAHMKFENVTGLRLNDALVLISTTTDIDFQVIKSTMTLLLQHSLIGLADTILRKVIGVTNPFDQQNDNVILEYLRKEHGQKVFKLLLSLKNIKNFDKLSIQKRFSLFMLYWHNAIPIFRAVAKNFDTLCDCGIFQEVSGQTTSTLLDTLVDMMPKNSMLTKVFMICLSNTF